MLTDDEISEILLPLMPLKDPYVFARAVEAAVLARGLAVENDDCWPGRAPHRAVLLGDVGHLLDGGDLIQLAQPRNEQAMRTAELCLSAWATARMDALERQVAAYKPLVQVVRNVLEEGQMYAEDLTLLRLALQQVERANG